MLQVLLLGPGVAAVAHGKFQRPQIRRVQSRVVHLGENSVFKSEPDFGFQRRRRADSFLASRRPRRHYSRRAGSTLRAPHNGKKPGKHKRNEQTFSREQRSASRGDSEDKKEEAESKPPPPGVLGVRK